MSAPRTAVVIVNWNGLADTRSCLRSLAAVREEWWQCVVVDNASADDSRETLPREFPWIDLVAAGDNLGYAGGNNLGIRRALDAGATEVFVLNNDATVASGTIAALRDAVCGDGGIGIAGPLVYRATGDRAFWYGGGRVWRKPFRGRELDDPEIEHATALREADYVPGCALIFRRDAIERIGIFDPRFFLTWEDTELAARARERGLRSVVVPGTRVWHLGSQSFDRVFSPLYSYYYFRNMLLFAHLHFPAAERRGAYADVMRFARRIVRRSRRAGSGRAVLFAVGLGILHFAAGRYGIAPRYLTEQARRARLAGARAVSPAHAGKA